VTREASIPGGTFWFRSVFTKGLRDSRSSILVAVTSIALFLLVGAAAIATAFGTESTRREMVQLANTLPSVFQAMLGRPVALERLGGLIEWRYQPIFLLLLPIWSIVALSGTIAGEADRGSMDVLASTPLSRRRIALEKLAVHLVAVGITALAITVTLVACGAGFATLPGDEIPVGDAAAYAFLVALFMLVPGSVAFAAGPWIGRGASAGLAALAMVAAYLFNGFRDSIPLFETLTPLSWYAWTRDHIPLGGRYDWPSLAPLLALAVVLLAVGVVSFERRDIGRTVRVPTPRLPGFVLGLRGPLGRTFGDRVPTALAWGIGIGLYVLVVAGSATQLGEMIRNTPALQVIMRFLYPDIDYGSVGGVLQLVFLEFGLIVFGFAAASLVAGWASEEGSGRLDGILAAPLTRVRWMLESGLGTFFSIILAVVVVAVAAGVGAVSQGSDAVAPATGAFVLALYGLAFAGVGLAVGGLFRSSLAAPTVVVLTVGMFLIALFATALDWPDWVGELVLGSHYGKPMVGAWDPVGIVASLVLAFGGLAVAAFGLARRDIRG
jgi:ABC-2 type transport system permease protein